MDETRWPDRVSEFVSDLRGRTEGLTIEVKQVTAGKDHYGWLITGKCEHCHTEMYFQVGGHPPRELENPPGDPIPEPAWWPTLLTLPPGGTEWTW